MKSIVLTLIFVFFSGAIFAQPNAKLQNSNSRQLSSACGKSGAESFKVTVYADGKRQAVKTFVKGFLTKEEIVYEIDKKKTTGVTKYYYTKSGKINSTEEWKNGKKISRQDRNYEFDVNLIAQYLYSADLLRKKEICIPSPGLIFSQLKDTAAVFDTADAADFKKEFSSDAEIKLIKFAGFDKNIRFDPTLLEINADQTITDYELALKNNRLYKEIYKTGASELKDLVSAEITREYTYRENRLVKVVTTSNSVGRDGKTSNSVTELKFVYDK